MFALFLVAMISVRLSCMVRMNRVEIVGMNLKRSLIVWSGKAGRKGDFGKGGDGGHAAKDGDNMIIEYSYKRGE